MPALPYFPLYPRAATPADTRLIESRQLADAAHRSLRFLLAHARQLSKRLAPLLRRDVDGQACADHFISGCYQGLDAGPSPAAIVGIVLGSIAGFLIVLWLLWIMSNGTTFIQTSALEVEDDVVVSRRRSRSPQTRRSQRSTYQSEMRRSSPRRDRVVRQERIVRDVPPPRRESSRQRETIIVEESTRTGERRVAGDDIVEVIEEHSSISGAAPPPRRQSRRSSYR